MSYNRIRLRRLTFTGPLVQPATLDFDDGLNIIYGASNTGKSFATKAVGFMLAALTKIPVIEQLAERDAGWLALTLPNGRDVTLYRSMRGGAFRLFQGHLSSGDPKTGTQLAGKADAKKTSNVSQFLLQAMGFENKVIVRDANGVKEPLSIRLLLPYAVVPEADIIGEKSPVLYSGIPTQRTFERNLFKFLLTGVDDASVVTVAPLEQRKLAITAKVELVDELIRQIDRELGEDPPEQKDLARRRRQFDLATSLLHDELADAQMKLDRLSADRRSLVDEQRRLSAQASELDVTLSNFRRLREVYHSDIARLASLEEGGAILVSMAERDCPVCGAPPNAQRHRQARQEIARTHDAARAEIAKIEIERGELHVTILSLEAEAAGSRTRSEQMARQIADFDREIQVARPNEVALRQHYEEQSAEKTLLDEMNALFERRAEMETLRAQLNDATPSKRETPLAVGPEETVGYEFGEVVRHVLTAWHFPHAERAQFDLASNDITIGGKPRSANGKGVRAILRSAFNVALLIYCRDKNLPHPGFLILDTPLLTFRAPLTSKHGALTPDEQELSQSGLASHFYTHLATLKDWAQIVVIENANPPADIRSLGKITTFSGSADEGRYGLLPPTVDQRPTANG